MYGKDETGKLYIFFFIVEVRSIKEENGRFKKQTVKRTQEVTKTLTIPIDSLPFRGLEDIRLCKVG